MSVRLGTCAIESIIPSLIKRLETGAGPLRPSKLPLPSLRRAFSLYDQINLFDDVPDDQLRFRGYSDTGFTVNGVNYEGSLMCVGNLVLHWSPKKFSDISADSLSIFQVLRPIPDQCKFDSLVNRQQFQYELGILPCILDHASKILVLGCGRRIEQVNPELKQFIRSTGMKLEAIDSRNAASTYNILNEEGRIVAAALIPYGGSS